MKRTFRYITRSLRWYPRGWKARHGDLLVGMLQDRADAGEFLPSQVRREKTKMMTSGIAERIRFTLPLLAGLVAVVLALVGMWQATYLAPPSGVVVWVFISPLSAVVAAAALVAAVQRQWHPRWIIVTIVALAATMALSTTIWMFVLPDESQPPLPLLWGTGAVYLILSGLATSVALAPVLGRQFSSVAAPVVGFACGVAGAVAMTAVVVTGFGLAVAGSIIVIMTMCRWRSANGSQFARAG